VLARARASADQVARESQALASRTEQDASDLLGDAHGRAEEIVQRARANAGDISHRAQQAYDDVVGGLSAKREMLQQQIEALECFDREYRARLTSFMQQQLRALWVDQPQPPIEVDPREVAELMAVPDDRSADLPAAPADR
ncbi:MAG: hypothetical protein HKP61_01530, partial [Dactylosporangium sp.]|nr:hypothetical protein [Dactylosporangium sp.]NNJ59646.1 hypothetical protein [Dactylosporangium sp.]